jgi:hypothetical protein
MPENLIFNKPQKEKHPLLQSVLDSSYTAEQVLQSGPSFHEKFSSGRSRSGGTMALRGHLKSGQRWSLQNRPTESGNLSSNSAYDDATRALTVNPSRAAVFLDGLFVGHVGEFEGMGRGMLVAPGTHQIRIALPGYQTFETDINPLANQKVEIKTELVKTGAPPAGPLVKTETRDTKPPSVVREAAVPPQR